jgi:hypothetical protein
MRKPIAWMKELVPQKGLEWQVVLTAHEEMAKDWEEPVIPLYTKQEWVGLTDEDIQKLAAEQHDWESLYLAVQAKLKERNT